MKPDQLLIGILVFSVLMVSGALIFQDAKTNYEITSDDTIWGGAENDSSSTSAYNNINAIKDISEDVGNSINKVGQSEGVLSALLASGELLIKGAYNAVRLITTSFGLMFNMINSLAATLGLPGWVVGAFYAMFLIAILFAIIYMMFRFKP